MVKTDRKTRYGGKTSPTQAKNKNPAPEQGIETEQRIINDSFGPSTPQLTVKDSMHAPKTKQKKAEPLQNEMEIDKNDQQNDQQEHPKNDKQEDSTMDEDLNPSQKELGDNLDPKTILIKQDKYYAYAPADGIKLSHKKKTRKVHQLLMEKVEFINVSLKKIKKTTRFQSTF